MGSNVTSYLPLLDKALSTPITIIICLVFVAIVVYYAYKIPPLMLSLSNVIAENSKVIAENGNVIAEMSNTLKQISKESALHNQEQIELRKDVVQLQSDVDDINDHMVTKTEFQTLQTVVLGTIRKD